VRFLIVPRFLAMMIMLPVLTIFGNYVGMLGGWAICHYALDFSTPTTSRARSRLPACGISTRA
jgi:phospholipid/cholesterol/gamma-HCH transport system permease protein